MMATTLLRLIFVLGTVLALQIDDDCVVKDNLHKSWLWSEARLSVWIPEGEDGTVLEITMVYGDFIRKKYNAIIDTQDVKVTLTEGSTKTTISSSSRILPAKGWTDFVYSTDTNNTYISIAGSDREMLANFTTADTSDTASIEVSGSNLTLNCRSGIRVWDLKGTSKVVPLDGSHEYRFTIFSKKKILPTFKLGKETFSLSVGETGITSRGSTSKALPPFLQHNLTIECTQRENSLTSCSIKLGQNQTTDRIFYMNERPQYLAVEGRPHDRFYLLLHKSHLDKEHTAESRHEDAPDGASIGLGVGIVIGIIGGIALITACFIYWKSTNATKKHKMEGSNEENIPLFTDVEKGIQSPTNSQQESRLLQAVKDGNVKRVKHEMNSATPKTLHTVEAHLRGNAKIIELFNKGQTHRNKIICDVQQELNKRLDEVFKAAKEGSYLSLDSLLRCYELPGSVRDTNGRSILHYIASCKHDDGSPLWEEKDIRKFLADYNIFPNAVDYEGQSCLHVLADSAKNIRDEITWSNKRMTVEDAWIELARILVDAGCDPVQKDYAGEIPHTLAKEKGKLQLHNFFIKNSKENEHPKKALKQMTLLDAISKNDIKKIKRLLLNRYPLLPLQASTDPLADAIRRGQQETTTLLLSAGAPLCAKSMTSITPLEVANDAFCAFFPALIRRECANRLRFEASKIIIQDPTHIGLRNHIEKLAKEIEQKGSGDSCRISIEIEPENNRRARDYLCIAASLGLSLVCQMLGFEDVFLQPLPHEDKPVKKAVENKQWQTLIVLYRDLNMSLFSITDEKVLPPVFLENVMEYENQKLQNFCKQWKSRFLTEGIHDKVSDISEYLQVVAKEGLVSIYHKLRKFKEVPAIDEPVKKFMGYNMLHIAAMHGQLNMVEYLLFNSANVMTKGNRNETALHLAALGGHRECMNYLQEHMKTKNYDQDVKAFASLTAEQIIEGYEALVSENSSVLLPEKHRQDILSSFATKRTKMILEKKGSDFGIYDGESFLNYTKIIAGKQRNSCCVVEKEMDILLETISKNAPRFKGKRVAVNPSGNLPFTQSKASLQMYWEVSDPVFRGLEPKHDAKEHCSLSLSVTDALGGSNMKDEFFEVARKSLNKYRFSSENMWLTYPCITKADIGTQVFIVYYDEGMIRFVRVLLVPVLKVTYSQENKSDAVSKLLEPHFKDPLPVYIANKSQDSWSYIVVQLEREILAHMSENQRLVLTACTLLTNVLYSPWWFPKEQSRRHGHIYGYYGSGLVVLPQRFLRTLFFEEITSTVEEDWAPSKFLERVTSIFKRATREVEGKSEVRVIPLFLDSRHSRHKASPIVFSVIKYLESLGKNDITTNQR